MLKREKRGKVEEVGQEERSMDAIVAQRFEEKGGKMERMEVLRLQNLQGIE